MSPPAAAPASRSAVDSILRPKSVVVIGASPNGRGFSFAPLQNLRRHGFAGEILAVNPRYDDIGGIGCFPSVSQLPLVPDTAVVVVGARRVPEVLEQCAELGVRSATVIAGGFAELGDEGAALQRRIEKVTGEGGVRLVGPNTAGLMNVVDGYVPRAALNHPAQLRPGGMAIVTQSGALCNTLLNRVFARGLGLSYAVATGSQWDLDLWDFVDYYVHDSRTRAIMTIVEGLKDAEKFLAAARTAAAAGKPLILLKPGRSELGRAAVQTHSGALSGAADVQISLMRDNGVIVVDELDELWETAQLFDRWDPAAAAPPGRPWRIGISTYSGGDGALAVDAAAEVGMECPPPSPATEAALSAAFDLATPGNPFDYTGEVVDKPQLIGPATAALVDDPAFDAFLVAAPVWSGHFARWIVGPSVAELAARPQRLGAVSLWSARGITDEAEDLVRELGLPLFDGSHRAIRAMGRYAAFARAAERWTQPAARETSVAAPVTGTGTPALHDYWSSRELLAGSGIAFNPASLASTIDEAAAAAAALGFPVTMKASAATINHKAAAGAIRLFVAGEQEVREAAAEMLRSAPDARIVVEAFTPSTAMAMLGGQRDPEFGPVLVLGLGGGYAEAYRDVAHVRCPAGSAAVDRALDSTTFGSLLRAGSPRRERFVAMVVSAADWFARQATVTAFDVNPILFDLADGVVAVDARVETLQT